ncbi:MAG: phosphoribosylaminoimidazolesuccinocarboxamide synthase [Candidatus Aenigmarchaeota archaeon]|nr:phosphoribosylaminoimidazolesuccinocarboxamide synthase [Candidatus Aenigmarchaeota archaeon]
MGSVKSLRVIRPPGVEPGYGIWTFGDRYSVFNLKRMPDLIPGAGAARAMMGAATMEMVEARGIPTTYRGMVDGNDDDCRVGSLREPSAEMMITLLHVHEPPFADGRYDYASYEQGRGTLDNYVVPLELIFRNGLPAGSSILERLEQLKSRSDTAAVTRLMADLGLEKFPAPGTMLPTPYCDITTKFEADDRPVTREEALRISGLTEQDFRRAEQVRDTANEVITARCKALGWTHYDGKAETVRVRGQVALGDVAGTPDENRIYVDGFDPTKEFLRQHHRRHQPRLLEAIRDAKAAAKIAGAKDFRPFLQAQPEPLPPEIPPLVGEVYQAMANDYIGRRVFDVRPLGEAIERLQEAD